MTKHEFTYDEVPESEYASSIVMSSQKPQLEETSILPPLLPSSMPAETDENSYDMSVPPLIGSTFTPTLMKISGWLKLQADPTSSLPQT